MGAMAAAILVVNNLRDLETDSRTGKRTLAVRMGPIWTKVEFCLLLLFGFLVPFLGMAWCGWGAWTLLTLLACPLLAMPLETVIIPALEKTAQAVGLYGLLLGATLALG